MMSPVRLTAILVLTALSPHVASASMVTLQQGTATFSQSIGDFSVDYAIDGLFPTADTGSSLGWAIGGQTTVSQTAAFETATDVGYAGGTQLTFNLFSGGTFGGFGNHTLGRFRLSSTTDARSNFANGLNTGGDVTANWTVLTPTLAVSTNATTTLAILGDQSIQASGVSATLETYTITANTSLVGITGFRLEMLEYDNDAELDGPGRSVGGNFVLRELTLEATAVPEPASALLTAMGLGVVLARRRSPRRKIEPTSPVSAT